MRPEEWERPQQPGSEQDKGSDGSDAPDPEGPTNDPSDAELPADHPFAQLAGDNRDLAKAMAMALRVLRDHTDNPKLADRLQSAADGRTSLRDLAEDPALDAAFAPGTKPDSTTSGDEEAEPDNADELLAARSIELPEQERARASEAAQQLVNRLTDNGALVDEVKSRFGVD